MRLLKIYANAAILILATASLCVWALPKPSPGAAQPTASSAEITTTGEAVDDWGESDGEEQAGDATVETAPEDELAEYRVIVDKNIFGYMATSAPQQAMPEIMEPLPILAEGAFEVESRGSRLDSQLSVTGIMSIREKERRVILKDNESGRGFYLGVGGEALGARVVEINKDSVVLESPEGGRTTLYMVAKKPSAMIPYGEDGEMFNTGKTAPQDIPAAQRARTGR